MDILVWGFVVLVVFPLLQMPVILYIVRQIESDDEESSQPAQKNWTGPEYSGSIQSFDAEPFEQTDSSTVVCPRCDTENDTDFTYCRNCITKLHVRVNDTR